MAILFIGGQALGILLKLLQWPEMLGMIGFGMLFANMGCTNFDGYLQLEAFFRCISLVFRIHPSRTVNLTDLPHSQRFGISKYNVASRHGH